MNQLGAGELSVGVLQARLHLFRSALSQHFTVLREEGVVTTMRQSQMIFYRVANPAAIQFIATLAAFYWPAITKAETNS